MRLIFGLVRKIDDIFISRVANARSQDADLFCCYDTIQFSIFDFKIRLKFVKVKTAPRCNLGVIRVE